MGSGRHSRLVATSGIYTGSVRNRDSSTPRGRSSKASSTPTTSVTLRSERDRVRIRQRDIPDCLALPDEVLGRRSKLQSSPLERPAVAVGVSERRRRRGVVGCPLEAGNEIEHLTGVDLAEAARSLAVEHIPQARGDRLLARFGVEIRDDRLGVEDVFRHFSRLVRSHPVGRRLLALFVPVFQFAGPRKDLARFVFTRVNAMEVFRWRERFDDDSALLFVFVFVDQDFTRGVDAELLTQSLWDRGLAFLGDADDLRFRSSTCY